MEQGEVRSILRPLKSLTGPFAASGIDALPGQPREAFLIWLREAIGQGVAEPHAMVLSTVDAEGRPDARVLILKALDDRGWHFATSALSPKGRQLARAPQVALTFYWQALGRQVRIRGRAVALDRASAEADFRERSPEARAVALSGAQSTVTDRPDEIERRIAEGRRALERERAGQAEHWQVFAVDPETVEFWQGATSRLHLRLRYRRESNGIWITERLWP